MPTDPHITDGRDLLGGLATLTAPLPDLDDPQIEINIERERELNRILAQPNQTEEAQPNDWGNVANALRTALARSHDNLGLGADVEFIVEHVMDNLRGLWNYRRQIQARIIGQGLGGAVGTPRHDTPGLRERAAAMTGNAETPRPGPRVNPEWETVTLPPLTQANPLIRNPLIRDPRPDLTIHLPPLSEAERADALANLVVHAPEDAAVTDNIPATTDGRETPF